MNVYFKVTLVLSLKNLLNKGSSNRSNTVTPSSRSKKSKFINLKIDPVTLKESVSNNSMKTHKKNDSAKDIKSTEINLEVKKDEKSNTKKQPKNDTLKKVN